MEKNNAKNYDNKVHRFGRISLIIGGIGMYLIPVIMYLKFGLIPKSSVLIELFFVSAMFMLPAVLSEVISFSTMLGSSALYIMQLTGNLANLKIPSSTAAMESVGLDPTEFTEESDIISTVAMTVSTIVCEIIIFLGVILLVPLSGFLNSSVLKPAFDNIIPALFGAIGVSIVFKNTKLSVAPFIVCFILFKFTNIHSSIILPIAIVCGIAAGRIMYKKNVF